MICPGGHWNMSQRTQQARSPRVSDGHVRWPFRLDFQGCEQVRCRFGLYGESLSVRTDGDVPRRVEFARRSEDHTSELQSLMRISYAVFCLQKQNKKNKSRH